MKVLIIGYGKMGQAIESILRQRGHQVVEKIDLHNAALLSNLDPKEVDVAVEFSAPDAAYHHIKHCITQGIPVLSGTTGWLEQMPSLCQYCTQQGGTFFYAANFSLGVNLFFQLNKYLAKLMRLHKDYQVVLEEVHHTQKKDAPSGTAIALAEEVLSHRPQQRGWQQGTIPSDGYIPIEAKRVGEVPGTHTVCYTSPLDTIQISHIAHDRKSFALGAVEVAEWLQDKQGVLGMEDFLAS